MQWEKQEKNAGIEVFTWETSGEESNAIYIAAYITADFTEIFRPHTHTYTHSLSELPEHIFQRSAIVHLLPMRGRSLYSETFTRIAWRAHIYEENGRTEKKKKFKEQEMESGRDRDDTTIETIREDVGWGSWEKTTEERELWTRLTSSTLQRNAVDLRSCGGILGSGTCWEKYLRTRQLSVHRRSEVGGS